MGPMSTDELPWLAGRGEVGDTRDDGVRTTDAERKVPPGTPRRVDGGVVHGVELEVSILVHKHNIGRERVRVCGWDEGKRGEGARKGLRCRTVNDLGNLKQHRKTHFFAYPQGQGGMGRARALSPAVRKDASRESLSQPTVSPTTS